MKEVLALGKDWTPDLRRLMALYAEAVGQEADYGLKRDAHGGEVDPF